MPDLRLAAQAAVVAALDAAAAVTLPVYQHAPEEDDDAPFEPFHLIGDIVATPAGGKGGGLDRIEIEVLTALREAGREFVTPHMTAVRETLEDQTLASDDADLSAIVVESEEDQLLEDGVTYVGVQRFSLWAQPKD
jgi:hypothetical protein